MLHLNLPSLNYISSVSTTVKPEIGFHPPKGKNSIIIPPKSETHRKCIRCSRIKHNNEFPLQSRVCKECRRIQARERYSLRAKMRVNLDVTRPVVPPPADWSTYESAKVSICNGHHLPPDRTDWFFGILRDVMMARYPTMLIEESDLARQYRIRYKQKHSRLI